MRLPLPGPNDVIRAANRGYEALETAIGLVPRVVGLVGQVEHLLTSVRAVVSQIESATQQAEGVLSRTDQAVTATGALVERTGRTVARAETVLSRSAGVVEGAAEVSARVGPLLDRYGPALDKLEPVLSRIADTTSPQEVDAFVRLIDALPELVGKMNDDIIPILDTFGTVAPDVRDLLDVCRQLNEMLGAVPGLGRVKKKIEEEQDAADGAMAARLGEYRAAEEPPAAPARRRRSKPALVNETPDEQPTAEQMPAELGRVALVEAPSPA